MNLILHFFIQGIITESTSFGKMLTWSAQGDGSFIWNTLCQSLWNSNSEIREFAMHDNIQPNIYYFLLIATDLKKIETNFTQMPYKM